MNKSLNKKTIEKIMIWFLSEKEKTKSAEVATLEMKYRTESVSNQIEFFRETVKTLDNMIFGVKHRIEIENFKAGMK